MECQNTAHSRPGELSALTVNAVTNAEEVAVRDTTRFYKYRIVNPGTGEKLLQKKIRSVLPELAPKKYIPGRLLSPKARKFRQDNSRPDT